MKRYLIVFAAAVLSGATFAVPTSTVGHSEKTPASWPRATTSVQTQTVTTDYTYDPETEKWNSDWSFYAYYAKVEVPVNQPFTIWTSATTPRSCMMWINSADTEEDQYYTTLDVSQDWDGNWRFKVKADKWHDNDTSKYTTVPFLVAVSSDYLQDRISISYQLADVPDASIPLGDYEKPQQIAVNGNGTYNSPTFLFPNDQWGYMASDYYCTVTLEKSHIYEFLATSGTSEFPAYVWVYAGNDISTNALMTEISSADGKNHGVRVVPLQTGTYLVDLHSYNDRISFSCVGNLGRAPSEHTLKGRLEPGVRSTTFTPGRAIADTRYKDDVIDECLFDFVLSEIGTYRLSTSGARSNVLLRLYADTGEILAETAERSSADPNAFLVYDFEKEGRYYVGICDKNSNPSAQSETATVLLENAEDTSRLDVWDPRDDVTALATPLTPGLTSSTANPSAIDADGHGPHRLSAIDRVDWFTFTARPDFQYRIQLETTNDFSSLGWFLAAEFVTSTGTVCTATRPSDNIYYFTPPTAGTYFMRVYVAATMSGGEQEVVGADSPDYTVHSVAYSAQAESYGFITVNPRGLPPEMSARWRFASEDAWYRMGDYVLAKGTVDISVSDVSGYRAPSNVRAPVAPNGQQTVVDAIYRDAYDSDDDVQGGACGITIANKPITLYRTLWGAGTIENQNRDPGDWFSFPTQEGVCYNFTIQDVVPADQTRGTALPTLGVYDENGNLLSEGEQALVWGAPSTGTNYVFVAAPNGCDCSYSLTAWSVDIGTVKFKTEDVHVASGSAYVDLVAFRTSSEGKVSVNWGTLAGTAVPGADYTVSSGVLTWDNDAAEKRIRVKLNPGRKVLAESASFAVRLWPKAIGVERAADEYEAVVGAPSAAKVTIDGDAVAASPGKVSFAAWGDARAAFSDGDHPEITVAPGQDVRLWLDRIGGSNETLSVVASIYGDVSESRLTCATARWADGDSAQKWIGLRVADDYQSPATIYVRIDPAEGSSASFVSRRVVVRVNPALTPTGNDETLALACALMPYVGRYTVALVPESGVGPSLSVANGWLSLLVTATGEATVMGRLPNGTSVNQTRQVTYVGDLFSPDDSYVYIEFDDPLSGGIILLQDDGNMPVVACEAGLLYVNDESGTPIIPMGGFWDPDVSMQALFNGLALTYLDSARTSAMDVSGDTFSLSGGVTLSIDKATGVLTVGGNAGGNGVMLMAGDSTAADWPYVAYGRLDGGAAFMVRAVNDSSAQAEEWAEELPVSITFDVNGATTGRVFTESLVSYAGFAEVAPYVSADFAKEGYVFAGWRSPEGVIYQSGEIFFVSAFDATYTAQWNIAGLREAVGSGVDVLTDVVLNGGNAPWTISELNGAQVLRSGAIGKGASSVLSATVTASGRFSFDWKCNCDEVAYANCTFVVNGITNTIGGTIGWTTCSIDVAAGDRLIWMYQKSNSAYVVGEDCAWVDNFRFAGGGSEAETVPVRFDIGAGAQCSVTTTVAVVGQPFGDLPVPTTSTRRFVGWTMDGASVTANTIVPDVDCVLVAQWDYFVWSVAFDANGADNAATATPPTVSNYENQPVHIPGANGLVRAGYGFGGWTDGMGGIWNDENYIVTATNITLKAIWSLSGLDTVLGPGAASFAFDTSGDADWFVDATKSADGDGKSMRSGAIGGAGQTASAPCASVLSATAKASGTLTFDWTVQCDDYQDYATLSFAVNGTVMKTINGVMADWATVEVDISAGDALTWTFAKKKDAYNKSNGNVGEDCGWVDNLRFGRKTTVTFRAEGGMPGTTNVVAFAGEPIGELPYPTWSNYSLDYWKDPTNGVVTASWIVPETAVTLTAVTKAKEWRVVYDLAGGTAVTVTNESYVAGATFALPGVDSATKDGYALAGWTDGTATYDPGAVRPVSGGAELTFTAVWQPDYASALDCSGSGIKFLSGGDAEWTVQSDKVNVGAAALRSGKITATSASGCESWIEATVIGTGTLSFDWAVSCDDGYQGKLYAWAECSVGGVDAIYGTKDVSWRNVTLTLTEETNVVRWTFKKEKAAYNEGQTGAGQDRAWLDNLVWTPDTPVDFSGVVVTPTTTPAKLGITSDAFKDLEPGSEHLSNLVAWAQDNGKTVADVNAMTFSASGEPIGDDSAAYLLDCAPSEIATEAANFKVTSISVDGAGNVTVTPADDSAYGNGRVDVRYSATPDGEYTTVKPVGGSRCFIKLFLVK